MLHFLKQNLDPFLEFPDHHFLICDLLKVELFLLLLLVSNMLQGINFFPSDLLVQDR